MSYHFTAIGLIVLLALSKSTLCSTSAEAFTGNEEHLFCVGWTGIYVPYLLLKAEFLIEQQLSPRSADLGKVCIEWDKTVKEDAEIFRFLKCAKPEPPSFEFLGHNKVFATVSMYTIFNAKEETFTTIDSYWDELTSFLGHGPPAIYLSRTIREIALQQTVPSGANRSQSITFK